MSSTLDPPLQVVRSPSPAQLREEARAHREADGLCTKCAAIDFDRILWEARQVNVIISRRWYLGHISVNDDCPLCALISRLVLKNQDKVSYKSGYVNASPGMYCLDLFLWVTEATKLLKTDCLGAIRYLPDTVDDPETQFTFPHTSRLATHTSMKNHVLAGVPLGRRISPEHINFQLVSQWLNICDDGHRCNQKDIGAYHLQDSDFVLRVIEVATFSLVDAPPGCRYAALSYVWGSMNLSRLNKFMLPSSQGYMSILGGPEILPRSVQDAMDLCQELGIAYLWVDCLCILQHDAHDKHVQIQNMDRIYSEAYLTIVSAAGENANAGLPGVNPMSRQIKQEALTLKSLNLITTKLYTINRILNSYWYRRGWTFQEFILSKRVLVFLPDEIVFICREAVWTEDTILEDQSGVQRAIIELPPEFRLLSSLQKDNLSSTSRFDLYENIYAPAVTIFTQRDLSRENDALDAFSGIQRVLEPNLGPFVWGLPLQMIWISLLWHYEVTRSMENVFGGERRAGFFSWENELGAYNRGAYKRRSGFPSWTWAGYDYNSNRTVSMIPADSRNEYGKSWQYIHPAVGVFAFDLSEGLKCYVDARDTPLQNISSGPAPDFIMPPSILDVRETLGSNFETVFPSLLLLQGSLIPAPVDTLDDHYTYRGEAELNSSGWNIPKSWVAGENPEFSLIAINFAPADQQVNAMMVHWRESVAYRVPIQSIPFTLPNWAKHNPTWRSIPLG